MSPEAPKWREHFADCERDQLQRFPLMPPDSPLERAQYKVALEYLAQELQPHEFYLSRIFAFRADDVTRSAFYDFFGLNVRRPFCLRNLEWDELFSGDFCRKANSSISTCWHYFKPYSQGNFDWDNAHADPIIEDYPLHELFIRAKGIVRAPRSGHGWTDYWHWDGVALTHLPHWDWSWIS